MPGDITLPVLLFNARPLFFFLTPSFYTLVDLNTPIGAFRGSHGIERILVQLPGWPGHNVVMMDHLSMTRGSTVLVPYITA